MATLCAGTPKITVRDNRGLDVRGLRYNRSVDGDVATQYVDAQTHNALGQPTSSQDPRFFNTGTLNFQYMPALSGQVLQTASVDAGTAKACVDIADRPVWQHSQGRDANIQSDNDITVLLYYDALGRPLQRNRVTSGVSTGGQVSDTSDIWCYGDYSGPSGAAYDPKDTTDPRNANQRGQVLQHFDTAGLIDMSVLGYAVQGTALRQDRRFQATACDANTHWKAGPPQALYGLNKQWLEPDTEPDNLYSTRWTYNALGQVLTQVDAKDHQQQTAYDCAGRKHAASVTPKGGTLTPVTTAITYSATGEIDTRTDANNIQVAYAYEPQMTQRLISITASRSSRKLQALTYIYDGVGNVTTLFDSSVNAQVSFFRNRAVTPDRGYTYDALYQLITATGRENYVNDTPKGTDWPSGQFNPTNTSDYQAYIRSYTYDRGGNLTVISSSNWSGGKRTIVVGAGSNRAVSTANNPGATQANINTYFDLAGKSICLDANRNQPMYWTAFHQLYCVVTTYRPPASGGAIGDWSNCDREQYAYDGSGQRVRKYFSGKASGAWNFLDTRYLPGLELRLNTASGENLEVIVLDDGARVLNWAGGAGKPANVSNLQLRYQYRDRQNSCQIEADSDGAIITQEEYYPYGGTAVLASRSTSEVEYKYIRYSSRELDATGLYYYGLRYYQPWIGRWINPDPAGAVDGPNLYSMVRNNPVTLQDREGLMADSDPPQGQAKNSMTESTVFSQARSSSSNDMSVVGTNNGAVGEHAISAVAAAAPRSTLKRPATDYSHTAAKISRNQESPTAIPKKLHFVWLGGNISRHALSDVLQVADSNPDYEVNIWTNRPMSICATRTAMLDDFETPRHQHLAYRAEKWFSTTVNGTPRITIRDVYSTFSTLRAAMPSETTNSEGRPLPGPGAALESLFARELNGTYRNYAAASDIARMAILFEEGGVYLDVDVVPKEPLGELQSEGGLKYLFGTIEYVARDCNNVMAAPKKSPAVQLALKQIIENYAEFDTDVAYYDSYRSLSISPDQPGWLNEMIMRVKAPLNERNPFLGSWISKRVDCSNRDEGRFSATCELSGPGVFYFFETNPRFPERHFYPDNFGSRVDEKDGGYKRGRRLRAKGMPPIIEPSSQEDAAEQLRQLHGTSLPSRADWLFTDWNSPPDMGGAWRNLKGLRRSSI